MKFTTVVSTLLLASTAIAAPSKLQQKRHERLAKRLAEARTGRPLAVNYTSMGDRIVLPKKVGEVQYDSNWAGAVIIDSAITQVTGTFTIPTVKEPSGGSSRQEYGASAWVGIDGDTCASGMSFSP